MPSSDVAPTSGTTSLHSSSLGSIVLSDVGDWDEVREEQQRELEEFESLERKLQGMEVTADHSSAPLRSGLGDAFEAIEAEAISLHKPRGEEKGDRQDGQHDIHPGAFSEWDTSDEHEDMERRDLGDDGGLAFSSKKSANGSAIKESDSAAADRNYDDDDDDDDHVAWDVKRADYNRSQHTGYNRPLPILSSTPLHRLPHHPRLHSW